MQVNTEKAVQHIMDAAEEALGYYFSLFEEEKDSPPAAIAELREALDAYPLAELQDAAEAEEYYPGRFCMMIGGHHQGEKPWKMFATWCEGTKAIGSLPADPETVAGVPGSPCRRRLLRGDPQARAGGNPLRAREPGNGQPYSISRRKPSASRSRSAGGRLEGNPRARAGGGLVGDRPSRDRRDRAASPPSTKGEAASPKKRRAGVEPWKSP